MIAVVFLVVLFLFVGWRISRRRRSVVLAGLDSDKPTFAVAPPSRGVGKRRTESL